MWGIRTGKGSLQWRHNGRDSVSNHQPYECFLNRLLRCRSKKTSKLRVTGLCAGNSPVTGEYPAQMASNAENVSIRWRHHGYGSTNKCMNCIQRSLFWTIMGNFTAPSTTQTPHISCPGYPNWTQKPFLASGWNTIFMYIMWQKCQWLINCYSAYNTYDKYDYLACILCSHYWKKWNDGYYHRYV